MAGKKSSNGPTGETVAANVTAFRKAQNLTYAELSRRLTAAGRPIPELGLRNIERGQRKVDTDELVALAYVLGTNPNMLLIPSADEAGQEVESTAVGKTTAGELWDWFRGGLLTKGGTVDLLDSTRAEPLFVMEQRLREEERRKYGPDMAKSLQEMREKLSELEERANKEDSGDG